MKTPFSLFAVAFTLINLIASSAMAQVQPLDIEEGASYYHSDHFEVAIDAPLGDVWPHIENMGSWMPWMKKPEGETQQISEGDIINLYGNFNVEVAKIVPENMVLIVNLPSEDRAEKSQGIAMVSVSAIDEQRTVVSIYMSRIYYWFSALENAQRVTRSSEEFAKSRKDMFQNLFLTNLKALAEGK